jgi:hypothetical protein
MPFSFSWLELFLSVEKTYEHLLFLCVAEYVGEDGDNPELVELGGQLRAEAQHPQAERQLVLDLQHIYCKNQGTLFPLCLETLMSLMISKSGSYRRKTYLVFAFDNFSGILLACLL